MKITPDNMLEPNGDVKQAITDDVLFNDARNTFITGFDPASNIYMFYIIGADDKPIKRYNPVMGRWEDNFAGTDSEFPMPIDTVNLLTEEDKDNLRAYRDIYFSGNFNNDKYIYVLGETSANNFKAVNFETIIAPGILAKIKDAMKFLPRELFMPWYMENIDPQIADKKELIKFSFLQLFNQVNIEMCKLLQLSPWGWEVQKIELFYQTVNKAEYDALTAQIDDYKNILENAKSQLLIERYNKLPILGDPGLEVTRQANIAALLQRKEYEKAESIIKLFEGLKDDVLGKTLIKPITENITLENGKTILPTHQE